MKVIITKVEIEAGKIQGHSNFEIDVLEVNKLTVFMDSMLGFIRSRGFSSLSDSDKIVITINYNLEQNGKHKNNNTYHSNPITLINLKNHPERHDAEIDRFFIKQVMNSFMREAAMGFIDII